MSFFCRSNTGSFFCSELNEFIRGKLESRSSDLVAGKWKFHSWGSNKSINESVVYFLKSMLLSFLQSKGNKWRIKILSKYGLNTLMLVNTRWADENTDLLFNTWITSWLWNCFIWLFWCKNVKKHKKWATRAERQRKEAEISLNLYNSWQFDYTVRPI